MDAIAAGEEIVRQLWFARYADDPDGPFTVVCTEARKRQDAINMEANLPAAAFHDANAVSRDSDRRILAEALAGGAWSSRTISSRTTMPG